MLFYIILTFMFGYIIYLSTKYIILPYVGMCRFKSLQNVYLLPFTPVIGAFHLAQKSFKQHGDQNYLAKIAYQRYPNCRAIITNALDKVFIIITDAQLLKQYYLNQKNYIKDKFFIQNRIRVFGDGVVFAQGKEWAKQRKIMSEVFHFGFLQSFIPKISSIVNQQINQLEKKQQLKENNKKPCIQINSLEFCSNVAGKTVVKSFFGIEFNQPIKNMDMTVFLLKLISKVGIQQRTLRNFLFGPQILKLGIFSIDKQINEQIKLFRAITKNAIETKIQQEQNNTSINKQTDSTLLSILINKNLIDTQQGLTKQKIVQQFLNLFIAGTDTTSHLMGMLFYYLSIDPSIQSKLREQLKTIPTQKVSYKSISSLKYLQNIIKQTFRHYNYMVSTFPRIAIKEHKINDLSIKKNDIIMPGWAQLNYYPQYFPNPFDFNPDRWNEAEKKDNIDFVFSPFSNGSRSCLGKKFALLETKIMVYEMINKYQIKLKEGYVHALKAAALYEPVNPIILELYRIN